MSERYFVRTTYTGGCELCGETFDGLIAEKGGGVSSKYDMTLCCICEKCAQILDIQFREIEDWETAYDPKWCPGESAMERQNRRSGKGWDY